MNIRQDATRQLEQAKTLHRQGRLAEAMAIYGAVLARDPRWFEPHYLLAIANYQQGNAAEAYRAFIATTRALRRWRSSSTVLRAPQNAQRTRPAEVRFGPKPKAAASPTPVSIEVMR
jgi:tetratricopeptide (TPR) repeat protein